MKYQRMPIEIESPEQIGYGNIECNLTESSFSDTVLGNLDLDLNDLVLCYGDHMGKPDLRELIASETGLAADDVLVTAGAATASIHSRNFPGEIPRSSCCGKTKLRDKY